MLKGSDVHACVCLESLCISFVWLTASSDKFQQSQTCFHFSAWQPPGGDGNQSFTHSHECSESRSTTCCTNTLRTHWLTAAIKPVCGEQTESFYVGLNKTNSLKCVIKNDSRKLCTEKVLKTAQQVNMRRSSRYKCSCTCLRARARAAGLTAAVKPPDSFYSQWSRETQLTTWSPPVHTRNYEKLSRTFHFCVYACRPLY